MGMPTAPTAAIFASDHGAGDAGRTSIMHQVGTHFARKGGHIVCLAENGVVPVPLIASARMAGGTVQLVADTTIMLPAALAGITMEVVADRHERHQRVAGLADALVGLPGSVASVSALFSVWTIGQNRSLPVLLLNHHRAFEAMRGFVADVLAHGLSRNDRAVQFADSVEDLWACLPRLATEIRQELVI